MDVDCIKGSMKIIHFLRINVILLAITYIISIKTRDRNWELKFNSTAEAIHIYG